jgi:hypothetical protein
MIILVLKKVIHVMFVFLFPLFLKHSCPLRFVFFCFLIAKQHFRPYGVKTVNMTFDYLGCYKPKHQGSLQDRLLELRDAKTLVIRETETIPDKD